MLGTPSARRPEDRDPKPRPGGAVGLSVAPYAMPKRTMSDGPHNEAAGVREISSELRARAVAAEQRSARLEGALNESRAETASLVQHVAALEKQVERERLMTRMAQEAARVETEAARQV